MDHNQEHRDAKNESFRAGKTVQNIVNDAIKSGDYSKLSSQISDVLGKAADVVHDGLTDAVKTAGPWFKENGASTFRAVGNSFQQAQDKMRDPHVRNEAQTIVQGGSGVISGLVPALRALLGGFFTFGIGIFFIASLYAAVTSGGGMIFFSVFLGLLTAFAGWNLFKGIKTLGLIKRARKVLQMMDGRDTITTQEIANAFGKDVKWIADDLQAMIRDGVFQGKAYMDKEETAFMTSRKAYEQYLETMKAYEEKAAKSVFRKEDLREYSRMEEGAAAKEAAEKKKAAHLDKETQEILEEGRAFIAHIHQQNDIIPGEEISNKLYRLETIVTNIFQRVEADPKSAPDLHRLMQYYLPTTQKLVDTYATLDSQSVRGENIENAKREIEVSLDTINEAFERFLDQFFQSTAWDVSSDISVMGQMMAMDGLTGGNDFAAKQQQSN